MARSTLIHVVVGIMLVSGCLTTQPVHARALRLPVEVAGSALVADGGRVICRELDASSATMPSDVGVHRISPERRGPVTGLRIEMSGTAQLERFPMAKEAFLRAAETWEALIQSPVTVSLRVDYGETRFGQPFGPGFIGFTTWNLYGATYADTRARLVDQATSDAESALLATLPQNVVPTDLGNADFVYSPPAPLKPLGLLEDDPPSDGDVGFNSANLFDFDPSDGIDGGAFDFYGLALHEIGHALGFDSNVGRNELNGNFPVAPTIWDLYRVRAGVTTETFASATRLLRAGGRQLFFAGTVVLDLSTARPDGSGGHGGDRSQANHWLDDVNGRPYIGIMDPIFNPGMRFVVTNNDLVALDLFGYTVGVADAGAPTISGIVFRKDKLTVRGRGFVDGLALEINDSVVAAPVGLNRPGTRLVARASAGDLGLVAGLNRVRVIGGGGLRSNVFVVYVRV